VEGHAMADKTAKIIMDGKEIELPIKTGTIGPDVVDIGTLYKNTGAFTYDPGFTSTGSCESKITYIDGDAGILLYRGIPIQDLAEHSDFMEVCYLLLYGELPSAKDLEDFENRVTRHTMLHEQMQYFFRGFRRDAHPMAVVCGVVGAMSAFYHDSTDINDPWQREVASIRMIAKLPTIAARAYNYSIGQPFVYPRNDLDYAANFLHMCFSGPAEEYHVNPILVRAIDTIFTLHADHEQNASTTVVRNVASTGAHPYVAISSGISALWGRAHGGANESVIAQLEYIGSVDKVEEFIAKAKDPNDSFKLMGFGHRVYKNFDPRAKILKKLQDELKEELNLDSHLMEIAGKIEEIALNDKYFISRNLYPNIDFYTGIILTALKIPKTMFTHIFVIGRTVRRITKWIEFKQNKTSKIARPRQYYTGE